MLYISVKDSNGYEVRLRPGGTLEHQLTSEVLTLLKQKGVGFLKTESTVLVAVSEALDEAIYKLKSEVLP